MHLGYVIIYVEDVKATVNFYEKAFGINKLANISWIHCIKLSDHHSGNAR